MRTRLVVMVAAVFSCTVAFAADEGVKVVNVNDQPSASEVGRFQLARLNDVTVKIDSRTGTTWVLCPPPKKAAAKQSWCKVKDGAPYPAGPVGRYRVVDGSPAMMIDTVSGRVVTRCDDPTPEKSFSWCSIDE